MHAGTDCRSGAKSGGSTEADGGSGTGSAAASGNSRAIRATVATQGATRFGPNQTIARAAFTESSRRDGDEY